MRRLARGSSVSVAAIAAVSAVACAVPTAANAVTYCSGGLGPMGVCNQGHDHPVAFNDVQNTSGDLSCQTIKSGGADSSPNIFGWEYDNGDHGTAYNGGQPAYAAIYNKTTGTRNMIANFTY